MYMCYGSFIQHQVKCCSYKVEIPFIRLRTIKYSMPLQYHENMEQSPSLYMAHLLRKLGSSSAMQRAIYIGLEKAATGNTLFVSRWSPLFMNFIVFQIKYIIVNVMFFYLENYFIKSRIYKYGQLQRKPRTKSWASVCI